MYHGARMIRRHLLTRRYNMESSINGHCQNRFTLNIIVLGPSQESEQVFDFD